MSKPAPPAFGGGYGGSSPQQPPAQGQVVQGIPIGQQGGGGDMQMGAYPPPGTMTIAQTPNGQMVMISGGGGMSGGPRGGATVIAVAPPPLPDAEMTTCMEAQGISRLLRIYLVIDIVFIVLSAIRLFWLFLAIPFAFAFMYGVRTYNYSWSLIGIVYFLGIFAVRGLSFAANILWEENESWKIFGIIVSVFALIVEIYFAYKYYQFMGLIKDMTEEMRDVCMDAPPVCGCV